MALDAANFRLHFHRSSPRTLELRLPSSSPSTPSPAPTSSSQAPQPFSQATQAALTASPAPSPPPLYLYTRAHSPHYAAALLDGHARVLLAEWAQVSASKKEGVLGLRQPDANVRVKREKGWAGEWRWEWEGETYQWRRETNALGISAGGGKAAYACDLVREKPDPSIAVARYKAALKARAAQLEVLDYNLLRIDIADRKGLEITLLCVLLALLDGEGEDALGDATMEGESSPATTPAATAEPGTSAMGAAKGMPGQGQGTASNEVEITAYGEDAAYVAHVLSLLRSPSSSAPGGGGGGGAGMDLVVLQAHSADAARRAVGIAAAVKGGWYRLPAAAKGTTDAEGEGELFQYVRELDRQPASGAEAASAATPAQALALEARSAGGGARPRIQLNAPSASSASAAAAAPAAGSSSTPPQGRPTSSGAGGAPTQYAPPERLSIYLSKLRIAELEPKGSAPPAHPAAPAPSRAAQPSPRTATHAALAPSPGARPHPRPLSHGASPSPKPQTPPLPPSPGKEPRGGGVGKLLGRLARRGGHGEEH